ncbi:nitrile hydratase subunit beta [Paenarthrobacter nitroguajacolicus]|uniref:nitrile hydratase subunit beta n=1 Tax=Paenarthrobacter nitroguajacolicus TaxID=211146 RepID=UPI00248C5B26|nr:nitrile hydratase subunit beta [Paenarthrobacter nitroguajacolicus]MDI2037252.1 Nitrile hydratase subunit beta [Paenarthrobacter nitroguajacolicus]
MNGVFDLAGTEGLGPVVVPEAEPVFRAEWEKTVFPMFAMCFRAGFFGVDQFRHGIEQMDPAVYLKSPYYEHWIHTVEHFGEKLGKLDMSELDRRTQYYFDNPDAPLPEHKDDPELLAFVEAVVPAGATAKRESDKEARFQVGDRVRVVRSSPKGHTRRARYIRGAVGEVVLAHGVFIYPDTAGNGLGEDPEHVYTVRFPNSELWGTEHAEPNGSVYIDVWDPYIEILTPSPAAATTTEGAHS